MTPTMIRVIPFSFVCVWTAFSQVVPSLPSGQTVIDSSWGFSFSCPQGYITRRSELDLYRVFVGPQVDVFKGFVYSVITAQQHFKYMPDQVPKYTSSSDTARLIALSIVDMVHHIKTAESNVEIHTDSVTERRTDSGLRVFVIYQTEDVDSFSGERDIFHDDPFYLVAFPMRGDLVFIKFEDNIWDIVRTTRLVSR